MARLTFATQALAQTRANSIHGAMRLFKGTTDPAYQSYLMYSTGKYAAETLRWAIPFQDLDAQGVPIGTNWFVTVDDRCRYVLTPAEIATVPEWAAA